MSKKKSKKKKKNVNTPKAKKKSYKSLIICLCAVAVIAAVIVVSYVYYLNTSLQATDFANTTWKSVSAYDASSDEVDMATVYSNRYDSYQGSMLLNGDGTFTFWMSTGDPEDGTHSGEYTYNREKDKIVAKFDSGDKVKFKIIRNDDNSIDHIEVPYDEYTVWFYISE